MSSMIYYPNSTPKHFSAFEILFVLSSCPLDRSEGFFDDLFRRIDFFHKHWFHCFKDISRDIILWRESVLMNLSLRPSNRSLTSMIISIIKLSLHENDLSWLTICVTCHWSLISDDFESRAVRFRRRLPLSSFSWVTSARYQAFFKHFRNRANLSKHFVISIVLILVFVQENRQRKTLWDPLMKWRSQRISKILDPVILSQRFSIEKCLVHFRVFVMSYLQCWSSFSYFMHCKIHINQLLILEAKK